MLDIVRRELISLVNAAARLPRVLEFSGSGIAPVPFAGLQPVTPVTSPVVLVHGYLGTEQPWTTLIRRLHHDGFVNVFTLRYDSLSADIPQLATGLAEHVRTVMVAARRSHVHLIGHSLGGLVARYAVQRLALDRVTRSVITIATPHHGSPLARFGPGPAAAQLRPDSPLLHELPPLKATEQVRWAVIHAGADLIVPLPRTPEARCLAGYGHHSILNAPELADAVVAHLMGAEGHGRRCRSACSARPGQLSCAAAETGERAASRPPTRGDSSDRNLTCP